MKPKTGERVLKYATIVARAVVACASRGHTILYSSKLTAPRLQTLTYDSGGIVLDPACNPIMYAHAILISGRDFRFQNFRALRERVFLPPHL